MICHKSEKDSVKIVSEILKKDGVAVLPTDTVYGFSAVENKSTEEIIRKIKGRSETKPFICLISKPEEIKKYTDDVIPEKLLSYWPGPLTIIVNDKREKGKTTAFRCPGDEWIRKIIGECGCPVFSTSVNRSGSPVLDEENAIVAEFGKEVDLIVLDGDKKGAVPSTIVKTDGFGYSVIRKGAIDL